jgi:hypothetical protein
MTQPTLFEQLEVIPDKYYNTTNMSGDDLKEHKFRAKGLNRRVLNFFKAHSYENFTAWEVHKAIGINSAPITSIRRSMTDLTDMGYLVKLDGNEGRHFVQRPGQWKEKCFARQIK